MKPLESSITGQTKNRSSHRIIFFIFLSAGFYAIILQTTLFRELLVVVMGNEFILGISLFDWLIGIFFGALAGGSCAGRIVRKWETLAVSFFFLILWSPVSVTLIRFLYPLSGSPPGSHIPFFQVFWLSAVLIVPLSFFIGFTFPLAAGFDSTPAAHPVRKTIYLSRIYISEAGGFLLGGLLVSFVLAGRFNSYLILSMASLPLLLFLISESHSAGQKKITPAAWFILLIQLFWLTPYGNSRFDRFMVEKRWKGFSGSELIWNRDSRYQNLAIGKNREQFNLFANGQFSASFPENTDSLVLAAHLVAQHPNPKKILIIGQSITGLAEKLLKYDIREIQSLEIDEELVRGIRNYLPAGLKSVFSDPRFTIRTEDGRKFAAQKSRTSSRWDIVFLNVPEPSTLLLNRFYTREFFQDIAAIQSEDGILCLQTTSSENYLSGLVSQYTASIYRTLGSVFPHLVIAPGDKNLFFASKRAGIVSRSAEVLAERYIRTGAIPEKLARIFRSLYPPQKTGFVARALQSHRDTDLNTDKKPISNFYFNKILGWTSSGRSDRFFSFLERTTLVHLLIFLGGIFGWRLALPRIKRLKTRLLPGKTGSLPDPALISGKHRPYAFNILFVVAGTGFSGLSMELLVIYSFQHTFGYIYQLIGFIIALFMTGMPLGAHISTSLMKKKEFTEKKQIGLLALTQVSLAAMALVFPAFLKLASAMAWFGKGLMFILMALAGALVGMVFPLALQLLSTGYPGKTARVAGMADASDHLGGAFGAFFSGALLLPVLGTPGIGRFIALISVFSLLFLLIRQPSGDNAAG